MINFNTGVIGEILIGLRFYATGSFQIVIGDLINVHKSTVCRTIKKISHLVAALRPTFIRMPCNNEEILSIKNGFIKLKSFPM